MTKCVFLALANASADLTELRKTNISFRWPEMAEEDKPSFLQKNVKVIRNNQIIPSPRFDT